MASKRLTPAEVSAVDLATKGESYSHRRWPEDVLWAVINAELVRAGDIQPGEPRRAANRVRAVRRRLRVMRWVRRRSIGALATTP